MAAVPRCCFGFSKPTGLIFIVTARPTIFGQGHMGRTPNVAPLSPKRSIPSETAHVSSLAKRSTSGSRFTLRPVRESHSATGACRRTVSRYVFQEFEFHRFGDAGKRDPIENL